MTTTEQELLTNEVKKMVKDHYDQIGFDYFRVYSKLFQHVKTEDILEVSYYFNKHTCDLEYNDNYRIFPVSMKAEYDAIFDKGCCGSWDAQLTTSNGNTYLLGCNYGH